MSAVIPNPTTSVANPSGTFAFNFGNKDTTNDNGTSSNVHYWSGIVLSRQFLPYQTTRVAEVPSRPGVTVEYEVISAMAAYQKSSLEELRLAYYFYDKPKEGSEGSTAPGTVTPQPKKRAWEKSATLSVPLPGPFKSASSFTAVFPSTQPPSTPIQVQVPNVSVSEAGSYSSPFSSLTSKLASVSNQLFTTPSTKPVEGPPVQAMAALGLGSQPTTPARPASAGLFGQQAEDISVNFPRSPAAERVPAINAAETDWENARRLVAWRKSLLQQAQAEYDKAVRIEREMFKTYSEARMNLDK